MSQHTQDISKQYQISVQERIYSLKIILFGSYRPNEPLNTLKDELIKIGFINCSLCVEITSDLNQKKFNNLDKSLHCLMNSDLNLMVLFLDVDNAGVQREIDLIFDHHYYLYQKTILLEELDKKKGYKGSSSLLRADLKRRQLRTGSFSNRGKAAGVAEGHIKGRAKAIYAGKFISL